jgi:single-strand DNA-binding protein
MLRVTVAGRLTKDAVLRYTGDGTAVLGFTVAVDVGYGAKKHGVFIGCSLWGKRAESLDPYLKKGTPVAVTGNGDLRKWQGDNGSGSEISCRVDELTFIGSADKKADQESFRKKPEPQADAFDDDQDIPW